MHERPNMVTDQVMVGPTPTTLYTNMRKICARLERRGKIIGRPSSGLRPDGRDLSIINNMRETSQHDAVSGLRPTDISYEAVENRRMKGV
jgi:hypothetical protein